MSDPAPSAQAGLDVLDKHMSALNAQDGEALAATLHFPHYRLSADGMKVWSSPKTYLADFRTRAGEGWHHSAWDFRNVIAEGPGKVHLDVQFTRYREDGTSLGSFRSLWVVIERDGRWAAVLRSSFAR